MLSLSSPGCGSETVNVKEFAERRLIPRLATAIEQAALIQRADDLLQLFRTLIEDRFQRRHQGGFETVRHTSTVLPDDIAELARLMDLTVAAFAEPASPVGCPAARD